jgi:hypothetical protein
VGLRTGLDVCEKSRPHWDFFNIFVRIVYFVVLVLFWYWAKDGMLWIFPAGKIRRLRSGANPRSWVPEASMQTPRPPKPLIRSPDRSARSQSVFFGSLFNLTANQLLISSGNFCYITALCGI